jgi:hypothetical protein
MLNRPSLLGGAIAISAALSLNLLGATLAQAQWQNPQDENRRTLIRFRNNDPRRSIYALYITPYYVNTWRELLGQRILRSGSFIDMEFNYLELRQSQCDFRIKAVYADGSEALLEEPYNLCQTGHIQFGRTPSANPFSPFGR